MPHPCKSCARYARAGNYDFAWGALVAIGLLAFTLQWLMDERSPLERRAALGGA